MDATTPVADELAAKIDGALRRSSPFGFTRVTVTATTESIDLDGFVDSFHLKQVATETAHTLAGNRTVNNNIQVT